VYHCGESSASSITGTFTEYIVADTLFFTCAKKFHEKIVASEDKMVDRERKSEGGSEIMLHCKLHFMIFKAF